MSRETGMLSKVPLDPQTLMSLRGLVWIGGTTSRLMSVAYPLLRMRSRIF